MRKLTRPGAALLLVALFAAPALAQWRSEIRSDHYIVRSRLDKELTNWLCLHADAIFEQYVQVFQVEVPDDKMFEVLVFENRNEFISYAKSTGSTTIDEHVAGYYSPGSEALHLYFGGREMIRTTLYHEAFHQFLDYVLPEMKDEIPRWFDEGMAQFFESGTVIEEGGQIRIDWSQMNVNEIGAARTAMLTNSHTPLEELMQMPIQIFYDEENDKEKMGLHYSEALAFCYYLVEGPDKKDGRKALRSFFETMMSDASAEQAYAKVFADDIDEWAKNWRKAMTGMGGDASKWKKLIKDALGREQSTTVLRNAVLQIPADDKKGYAMLVDVLGEKDTRWYDWYVRDAVIESLAKLSDPKLLEKMHREMRKPKGLKGEGLVAACGKRSDDEFKEDLLALVVPGATKDTKVLRAAIFALGEKPSIDNVRPLIDLWQELNDKKGLREAMLVQEALEKITGQYWGGDPEVWDRWWITNFDNYVLPSEMSTEQAEELKAQNEAQAEDGNKERREESTVERVPLSFERKGKGIPMIVMADDTYKKEYLKPYLSCIEDTYEIYYMSLPRISEVPGVERHASGLPIYPVKPIADAFNALRQQQGYERFALMCHGQITSYIAQQYASDYPESVSHLILVNPQTGGKAFSRIRDAVEREGKSRQDDEMWKLANWKLLIDNDGTTKYEPQDSAEARGLKRKQFSMYFADPTDSELVRIWDRANQMGEGSIVPDFDAKNDVRSEVRANLPVLIIAGRHAQWADVADAEKMASIYKRSNLVVFPNSSMMPFIEETGLFAEVVKKFAANFSED